MGKFLKKNWFVILVVIMFASASAYYIYDTNKGKLPGKKVDGEDVVYVINDEDVTAADLYDYLYNLNGTGSVVSLIEQALVNQAVETTETMKVIAELQAESVIESYESTYGTSYEAQLASDLAATGFTDLNDYLIYIQKVYQITAEYAKANFDDLKIRSVSYILITFEDSENVTEEPTETEQAKMDAVDQALADGDSFADVAIANSEDSATASEGGMLGIIDDNTTSLDTSFYEAAMSLAEGEISDWIRSDNYGYFKIYCSAASPATLEDLYADDDPYLTLVESYDTSLTGYALWTKVEEIGIDFYGDEELAEKVRSYFYVDEDTTDEEIASDNPETEDEQSEDEEASEDASEDTSEEETESN